MQFEEFVNEVQQRTGAASHLEAIEAIRAVLATLSECLPGALANELAAQLPLAAGDDLRRQEWQPGERLTVSEFVLRVSQREGIPVAKARDHTHAVLHRLTQEVGPGLFERVHAELPADFESLSDVGAPGQVHMHQPVA
jgi:uncharacterized protein (DUF2267 family)